jgi:hypothetical protein
MSDNSLLELGKIAFAELFARARANEQLTALREAELTRAKAALHAAELGAAGVPEAYTVARPVALVLCYVETTCTDCGSIYAAPEGIFVDRQTGSGAILSRPMLESEQDLAATLPQTFRTLHRTVNSCLQCYGQQLTKLARAAEARARAFGLSDTSYFIRGQSAQISDLSSAYIATLPGSYQCFTSSEGYETVWTADLTAAFGA